MLNLIIFALDDRDSTEIAINPALVESVAEHGATADVRMTSGCIHRVKQRGDRSVRDWLTQGSRPMLKSPHELANEKPPSIFPAGSRVGLDMGAGESRSVAQRRDEKVGGTD